jgi:hypothetical protein
MKKHREINNFVNQYIPLKADGVFPVSSGNWKRKIILKILLILSKKNHFCEAAQ